MLKLGQLKFGVDGERLPMLAASSASAQVDCRRVELWGRQGSRDMRRISSGGGGACIDLLRLFIDDGLIPVTAADGFVDVSAHAHLTLMNEAAVVEPREVISVLVSVDMYDSFEPSRGRSRWIWSFETLLLDIDGVSVERLVWYD